MQFVYFFYMVDTGNILRYLFTKVKKMLNIWERELIIPEDSSALRGPDLLVVSMFQKYRWLGL